MKMFLATTALDEFWDRAAQEILFLGSWCTLFDRRERWEYLPATVLPSPWQDRRRFSAAAEYVDEFSERLLPELAEYLNGVHGERYSTRYWRILLGPWLIQSVHALYDRSEHLRDAAARKRFTTIGLDPTCYRVPSTSLEQLAWLSEDEYNLQLFTQLLEAEGHEMPRKMLPQRDAVRKSPTLRRKAAIAFESALRETARLSRRRVQLYDMYANRRLRLGLILRSRGALIPVESDEPSIHASAVFDQRRVGLRDLSARSNFERIYIHLLPHLLPVAFVEARNKLLPRRLNASVFASATGWYGSEVTRALAADAAERGAKIIAIQHGGGYGVFRHAPIEQHERRIADRFLTWGWSVQEPSKLRDIPAPTLSTVTRRALRNNRGSESAAVLFLATAHPRYLYRFHSAPVGSLFDDYFGRQIRFFRALVPELRRRTFYRGYLHDYGQSIEQRVLAHFHDIGRDGGREGTAALLRSRIVVIDHCSTGYLESLALNVPTILFWNRDHWQLREAAERSFDALRGNGILFDSPEDAAAHLMRIDQQPMTWWMSDAVQSARSAFVSMFARTDLNWEASFTKALLEEAATSPYQPTVQR
jgi:putative transferase (TIGR04331 family)